MYFKVNIYLAIGRAPPPAHTCGFSGGNGRERTATSFMEVAGMEQRIWFESSPGLNLPVRGGRMEELRKCI